MNNKLKSGIIILSIGITLYIGYLVFAGTALSHSLWTDNPVPVFLSIFLGVYLIVPLIALFTIAFIQIQKSKKYSILKFALIILTVIATPLVTFVTIRAIDQHTYAVTYNFTPTKWAEADTRDRSRLIESFRQQYVLVGENIDIVIDLLGEPDVKEESQYLYDLGDFKTPLAFDPYFYLVTFDFNDVITSEGIYQG